MVKVFCPVCGKIGVLEIRGNSRRVVHYYYENGKRVFVKHTVKREQWELWEQKMGTEKTDKRSFHGKLVLRPGFEPGSPARKAGILGRAILPEQRCNQ